MNNILNLLLYFTLALNAPQLVFAQNYSIGFKKYSKGDFSGAIAALKAATKLKQSRQQLAETYKLLAICYFNIGQKNQSALEFKTALKLNPNLAIQKREVLDESVIAFFNNQKNQPSAAHSAIAASPQSQAKTAVTGKKAKHTSLLIHCNVNATVKIDGILAGQTGSSFEAEPGFNLIELSAPGYHAKKAKVKVLSNIENTVTINLEKIKPKPKPAVVANTKPLKDQKRNAKKKSLLPDPGKSNLFKDADIDGSSPKQSPGRDLESEFALESGGYQAVPPPPGAGSPMAPQGQAPTPYAQPPMYAPMPMYPAPVYQPPPTYYAPAPYAQPYAPPPPPAPPPVDGLYADPYAAGGTPVDPNASPKLASSPAQKDLKVTKKSGQKSPLIALLPFGAGQFQNDNTVLGVAFLGAEALSLYQWYSYTQTADKSVVTAREDLNNLDCSTQPEPTICQTEKEQYKRDMEDYIAEQRQYATLALLAFGGLWAAGAIEAIINLDPPKPTKKTRRSLSLNESNSNEIIDETYHDPSAFHNPRMWQLNFALLPVNSQRFMAGISVQLKLK